MKSTTVALLLAWAISSTAAAQDLANTPAVTLQVSGVSPQEAFAQLGELAGVSFESSDQNLWTNRPASIDVDIKDQPFWLAVKQVCDQSKVQVQNWSGGSTAIKLQQGSDRGIWADSILVSSGPVLFVTSAVQRSTTTDLRTPSKTTREAAIPLTIYIDPRVRAVQAPRPIVVSEAVDDKGQTLKQLRGDGQGHFEASWCLNQQIALALPETLGSRLARVSGNLKLMVDEKTETWEIKLPMESAEVRKVGSFPLTVSEVKKEGNGYRVKVSYKRMEGKKEDFARLKGAMENWIRRLELRDESDQPLRAGGWGGSMNENEHSYELNISRGDGGETEAVKLVWPVPTDLKDLAVPFEFTDLPLE